MDWLKLYGYDRIGIVVCASIKAYKHYQLFLEGLCEREITFSERTIGSDPIDLAIDEIAKSFYHDHIQCVMGIGGGSVLDSAKAISFCREAIPHCMRLRGKAHLRKAYPLVCIPTTLGTGSEVSQTMVIGDHQDGKKKRITHEAIQADLIVLDPLLTMQLPTDVVKVTAADAFAHAMEGISNAVFLNNRDPMIFHAALQTIDLVINNLPLALQDKDNRKAKEALQWAAYHGGYCMRQDLNAAHVLAGALHQQYPMMSHGIAVGIILPEIMRFNQASCAHIYADIERHLFLSEGSEDVLAHCFVMRIEALWKQIEFPVLRQYWQDDKEQLLVKLKDRLPEANRLNPQTIEPDDVEKLLMGCLQRGMT